MAMTRSLTGTPKEKGQGSQKAYGKKSKIVPSSKSSIQDSGSHDELDLSKASKTGYRGKRNTVSHPAAKKLARKNNGSKQDTNNTTSLAAKPHGAKSSCIARKMARISNQLAETKRSTRSSPNMFIAPKDVTLQNAELAKLTQYTPWIYDTMDLKAKTERQHDAARQYEQGQIEEFRSREEQKKKREEKERIRAEEARKEAERQREEEMKRREEERKKKLKEREDKRIEKRKAKERLRQLKRAERERQRQHKNLKNEIASSDEESDSSSDEDDEDSLLKQRVTDKTQSMLVDGYMPFIARWREDVEIPIRDNFFVDEVMAGTVSQIGQLPFTTASMVIKAIPKKYKEYKNLDPQDVSVITPVFPNILESYHLLESQDFFLDPLEEIGRSMEFYSFAYVPEEQKLKLYNPHAPYESMVGRYSKAFFDRDYSKVLQIIAEFNQFMIKLQESGAIIKHLQQKKTFSRMCLHELLNQIYSRAVSPQVNMLKNYRAFSNEVYGELLPKFISMVFDQCGVNSSHRFIDLGSGVGNVTIQAALEYGCESYGVEIMKNCSTLAAKQEQTFLERSKLFGIRPGKVKLFGDQSFVGNPPVLRIIEKCDIILVNNFLFTPDLNKQTLQLFLSLKVGTKIISLKKVIPEARYHDFDNDFLSKFLVERHEFGAGCVSWTDASGFYYITTYTGQVSEERKRQLEKLHNTRNKESEFLKRSASLNLSSSSSVASPSPISTDSSYHHSSSDEKERPHSSELEKAKTESATGAKIEVKEEAKHKKKDEEDKDPDTGNTSVDTLFDTGAMSGSDKSDEVFEDALEDTRANGTLKDEE